MATTCYQLKLLCVCALSLVYQIHESSRMKVPCTLDVEDHAQGHGDAKIAATDLVCILF